MAAALQIPRVFPWDPATKVQKHSSPPISGLKLTTKVDKSRAMRMSPGLAPGVAADKSGINA